MGPWSYVVVIISVGGALFGAILGLRFKVLVLVPAMLFVLVAALADGILRGQTLVHVVAAALIGVATLQVGYLAGVAIRFAWVRLPHVLRRRQSPQRSITESTESTR
jgi:hypothetical protein